MVSSNAYCDRLKTLRVPRVEEFVGRRGPFGPVTLFDLTIVALLENGGPMTLESVAERLQEAGAHSGAGDMILSLKKSWRRREPIYEDEEGLLALDLPHPELDSRLFTLGLRPPYVDRLPEPPPIEMPGDGVALSLDEVDAAFRGRRLYGLSSTRLAAAVLDAHGEPMTPLAIDEYLALLGAEAFRLTKTRWDQIHSDLVQLSGSALALRRDSPQLAAMRQAIRRKAEEELRRRARSEHFRKQRALAEVQIAEREERERAEASALRRVILRLAPDAGEPAGVSALDLQAMTIRTFLFEEIEEAPDWLGSFDVAAGIDVRDSLKRLGLPLARFRTVDLGPPRKTLKLNRRGDRLRLTPELVISGSTGIRRPLSDPARIARDIAAGRRGPLRKALERDLISLLGLYEYARLHRYVRVRRGSVDERLPFDWPIAEEELLYPILVTAERQGRPVEIVLGDVPDWKNPWANGQRGYVSQFRWGIFRFQEGPMIQTLDCADVQAARWLSSGASLPTSGKKDATASSGSGQASGVTREPNSRDERLR